MKKIFFVTIMISIFLYTYSFFITINTTPSIYGTIFIRSLKQTPEKDDYIRFKHPNYKKPLLKKIDKIEKNQIYFTADHEKGVTSKHLGTIEIKDITIYKKIK